MTIDLDKLNTEWSQNWSDKLILNPHNFDENRWVRFHSLSGSERYPQSEEDYKEIFARSNAILSTLNPGESIYVVISEWSDKPDFPTETQIDTNAIFWKSVLEKPISMIYRLLFVDLRHWDRGRLDEIIKIVADDKAAGVFFLPPSLKWVYHPYDGGMDIVLDSTEARDKLRNEYYQWLPDTESKL